MNKYVSIDIETTGLDPDRCQVLEIGAIVDDWDSPLEALPTFHCYVAHEKIVGEPYALAMNADILRKIGKGGDSKVFLAPEHVSFYLRNWLLEHYGCADKVLAAGKNFGAFDLQFLKRLPEFSRRVAFRHRFIDPAMLYWNPEFDEVPPSMEKCLSRAGIRTLVSHTAVEDALTVVNLIRAKFNK